MGNRGEGKGVEFSGQVRRVQGSAGTGVEGCGKVGMPLERTFRLKAQRTSVVTGAPIQCPGSVLLLASVCRQQEVMQMQSLN